MPNGKIMSIHLIVRLIKDIFLYKDELFSTLIKVKKVKSIFQQNKSEIRFF